MSVVVVCGPKDADFDPVLHALSNAIEDVIVVSVDMFEDSWLRTARSMGDRLPDAISQWPLDVSDGLVDMIFDIGDGNDGDGDGNDGDDQNGSDGEDGFLLALPDNSRLRPLKIAFLKLATDYALEQAEEGEDCVLVGVMDEEDRDFVIREFEMKFDSVEASPAADAASKEAYLAWRTCANNTEALLEVIIAGGDAKSAAKDCVAQMEKALGASAAATDAVEADRKGETPAWSEHAVKDIEVAGYGDGDENEPDPLLVELCQATLGAAKAAQAAASRSFDDDGSFSVQASDAAKVALAAAMCMRDALDASDDDAVQDLIDHVNSIVDDGVQDGGAGGEGASLAFIEVLGDSPEYVGVHEAERLDTPTFVTLGDHGCAVFDPRQDPPLLESTLNDEAMDAALRSVLDAEIEEDLGRVVPDDEEVWKGVMGHMMA